MSRAPHFEGTLRARMAEGPRGFLVEVAVPTAAHALHRFPGQFCELSVGDEAGYFALARSPGAPGPFAFYVQPDGGCADALVRRPLGTPVRVGAPAGDGFRVDDVLAHGGPSHVLATGSGYAGVRSALLALVGAGARPHVYLGFRARPLVIFREDLDWLRAVGCPLTLCFSRAEVDDDAVEGYVQQALEREAPDLSDGWLLVCGQPEMQTQAAAVAATLGLPAGRLLTNY